MKRLSVFAFLIFCHTLSALQLRNYTRVALINDDWISEVRLQKEKSGELSLLWANETTHSIHVSSKAMGQKWSLARALVNSTDLFWKFDYSSYGQDEFFCWENLSLFSDLFYQLNQKRIKVSRLEGYHGISISSNGYFTLPLVSYRSGLNSWGIDLIDIPFSGEEKITHPITDLGSLQAQLFSDHASEDLFIFEDNEGIACCCWREQDQWSLPEKIGPINYDGRALFIEGTLAKERSGVFALYASADAGEDKEYSVFATSCVKGKFSPFTKFTFSHSVADNTFAINKFGDSLIVFADKQGGLTSLYKPHDKSSFSRINLPHFPGMHFGPRIRERENGQFVLIWSTRDESFKPSCTCAYFDPKSATFTQPKKLTKKHNTCYVEDFILTEQNRGYIALDKDKYLVIADLILD